MEIEEKVDTSTPAENGGKIEPVNTTETEKKQVEEGFDEITDNDLEDNEKSKEENETEPKQDKENKQVDKTFTQADLDKIVEKRVSRMTAQHKKELEELEQRYKSGDYSPEIKSLTEQLTAEKEKTSQFQGQLARYEIDTACMKEEVVDDYK